MILLIDNYDSFSYNLLHYFHELGAEVMIVRNDSMQASEALAMNPAAVVLSPGPCAPDQAGLCLDLVHAAPADLPILGVCLGHQVIGQAFGGVVMRSKRPIHGKPVTITHGQRGVFAGLPTPFDAIRYNSLTVSEPPPCLDVVATDDAGEIMGMAHRTRPIHGVQFHPESIGTAHGHQLLATFLETVCR